MCKHLDEMELYEYLDNVLEAKDKVKVANHLSICSECRQTISEIKLMYYELDHLDLIEVPSELENIRQRVVNEAFEGEKVPVLKTMQKNILHQQEKLTSSFLGRHAANQKYNVGKFGKGVWLASKKLLKSKKHDKTIKEKTKKRLSLRRLL